MYLGTVMAENSLSSNRHVECVSTEGMKELSLYGNTS